MRHLTISLALFAASALLAPVGASAQEDTTPPVLLEFTIAPVVFDTGPGPVDVTFCATAEDDLSGFGFINVGIAGPTNLNLGPIGGPIGELLRSGCRTATVPQFFPFGLGDHPKAAIGDHLKTGQRRGVRPGP